MSDIKWTSNIQDENGNNLFVIVFHDHLGDYPKIRLHTFAKDEQSAIEKTLPYAETMANQKILLNERCDTCGDWLWWVFVNSPCIAGDYSDINEFMDDLVRSRFVK